VRVRVCVCVCVCVYLCACACSLQPLECYWGYAYATGSPLGSVLKDASVSSPHPVARQQQLSDYRLEDGDGKVWALLA